MQISDLVYIDTTGYHFADYPTFLQWLKEQYQGIYGADVYLESDSQDGQWLAIVAQSLYDVAAVGGSIFNSFSPVTGQGVGLSRLVKINGIARQVPSKSSVDVTIVGVAATVITNGVVQDTLQQKWDLPATVTIPGGGAITGTATAQEDGAVTAEASTVTTIFTPTQGWQTVTNADPATPGAPVETDAELRVRQALSTANPSLTVLDGTTGGVANLAGVQKVKAYENDTDSTDANGIPEHSISMVVVGGDDTEICEEIALHKTPGTGTAGDTSEIVYDAHGMPLEIKFQRAVTAEIQAQITIAAGVGWSEDFEALIQAAVAEAINAGEIGVDVLLSKMYAPAYLLGTAAGSTFTISGIELGINSGGLSAANVNLDYDENPVCDPDVDVTVVVT